MNERWNVWECSRCGVQAMKPPEMTVMWCRACRNRRSEIVGMQKIGTSAGTRGAVYHLDAIRPSHREPLRIIGPPSFQMIEEVKDECLRQRQELADRQASLEMLRKQQAQDRLNREKREHEQELEKLKRGELDEPVELHVMINDSSKYRSPFYTDWALGDADGGAEDYHRWRHARDDFTRTGQSADKEKMLIHVTLDNPPLDCDIRREPSRREVIAGQVTAMICLLAAVLLVLFAIVFFVNG